MTPKPTRNPWKTRPTKSPWERLRPALNPWMKPRPHRQTTKKPKTDQDSRSLLTEIASMTTTRVPPMVIYKGRMWNILAALG
jgi:hypothetical protein